jgi:predicted O-methyltransferase YrrM
MKNRGLVIDQVLVNKSHKASEQFLNHSLDFVWIDAAHDYFNVKRDILSWTSKLKRDGIILFHDYPEPTDPHGGFEDLVKAVHETVKDSPLFYNFGYFCGICGAIKK